MGRSREYRCGSGKVGLLDGGGKPSDLYVRKYAYNKDHAFDVTVKSLYQNAWVKYAAAKMLLAEDKAEKAKYDRYKRDIRGKDWIFQPLAMEKRAE